MKKIVPIIKPVNNNELLAGKVALVTGGSGGIGLAIAKGLLASGSKVILCGTNADKLYACAEKLTPNNYVSTYVLRLDQIESFKEKIEELIKLFGHIDIYVNAAGIHIENVKFGNISEDDFNKILDINLKGPYYLSNILADYWIDNKIKGHMLFISSSRGSEPAWSPYSISKWALNGMVKGLAKELLPYGIIVNAIAPGTTATPLLGISEGDSIWAEDNIFGRMAIPEEIGTFACLLVSSAGDMVAGEIIHMSGGRGVFDIR